MTKPSEDNQESNQELSAADGEQPAAEGIEEVRRSLLERDNQYLRLAADFENFKRRKAQELADRSRFGAEDLLRELLPVLDNLQRAMASAPAEGDPFGDGVRLVARDLQAVLERAGVTQIAAEGERDTVGTELQPGYRLHDRVLRPAMVRVVHPAAAAPATEG
jgi:molecular chaperone GrpE